MKAFAINSTTVIPRLKIILEQDLEALAELKKQNNQFQKFVKSLMSAKRKMISILPGNMNGMEQVPTTGSVVSLKKYDDKIESMNKDEVALTKLIYQTELSQYDFVKKAQGEMGLPVGLQNILGDIASMYQKIIDQLKRAKNTHSLNPIVV